MSFYCFTAFRARSWPRRHRLCAQKIDADYLIKYQLPSGITFFFSVKQKDGYCGRSLFINNELDYSRGQTKFTLLEKTKTNLRTGEQILLYRRSTYQK